MLNPLAIVVHILSTYFAPDGVALARTAPEHLDVVTAAHHVAAAEMAGGRFNVDPNLLLSIAAHESHYQQAAVTPEIGGLVSCGVMTPTPQASCSASLSGDDDDVYDGYYDGAEHLRAWLDATKSTRSALLGYAGGYRLIAACNAGPVLKERGGRDVDLCSIADVFLFRAKVIKRERARVRVQMGDTI